MLRTLNYTHIYGRGCSRCIAAVSIRIELEAGTNVGVHLITEFICVKLLKNESYPPIAPTLIFRAIGWYVPDEGFVQEPSVDSNLKRFVVDLCNFKLVVDRAP